MKTPILTLLAMLAFAANSLLCRAALDSGEIDAAGFTVVRLLSGALVLAILIGGSKPQLRSGKGSQGSWRAATALFLYAAAFSFAYLTLTAATGALLLFGAVQVTMMAGALWSGERPGRVQWIGKLLAFGGLIYLLLPGLEAPPLGGSLLMILSGFGWGLYSLFGKGNSDPLRSTAWNFIRSIPPVLILLLAFAQDLVWSTRGLTLAVISGGLTSGIGYAIWYAALRGLTATQAAVVQLSVPVIAAAGGLILLAEAISLRLLLASVLVLGGIALSLARPGKLNGQAED